jgi:vancomycin resistance protein VanJ
VSQPPRLSPDSPPARRLSGRRVLAALAIAYTAALVLVMVLFRLVGESWWVTTAGLYLPRAGFALPLPLLALGLAVFGPRRLLWLMPLPAVLVLYPLMGLRLRPVATAHAAGPTLRIVSYNIQGGIDAKGVAAAARREQPDLLLLQEWDDRASEPLFTALPGYRHYVAGQFAIYSRYPVIDIHVPPRIALPEMRDRAARFVRYTVQTPFGPTAVLNIHPVSPRNGLDEFRRNALLDQLREGTVGPQEGIAALKTNAVLRWRQAEAIVQAAAQAARTTEGRVIIAGDSNLPGLSRIFALTLASYHDGFDQAGHGFGYTFPAEQPWMRIDRVLASAPFRFTRFEVLPDRASDHLAVAAELTLP